MIKKTIPFPLDVEYITTMIFHLLKMLFRKSNIFTLHRTLDMEKFLAIRHEVLFMRDEDWGVDLNNISR